MTEPDVPRPPVHRAPFTAYDLTLYGITIVVWTFSWLGIHFQVGPVPAEVSVMWRFALAAPIMMGLARLNRQRLAYPFADHARFVVLGMLLFSTSFVLFYQAAVYLASGLLAVVFSLASIINVFLGAIVLREPIDRRIVVAGACGTFGVGLLFYPQIVGSSLDAGALKGLGISILATFCFCAGNMLSARLQRRGIPVFAASGWGMVYGTIFLAIVAFALGRPFIIDPSPLYLGALVYLAVFATVVAFACYLTMLGRIGADRAAYAMVVTPASAMIVSAVFESYRFTPLALVGLAAVVAGNLIVLRAPRRG
jgi:drug/metabolite transporter (DMT)-like permease